MEGGDRGEVELARGEFGGEVGGGADGWVPSVSGEGVWAGPGLAGPVRWVRFGPVGLVLLFFLVMFLFLLFVFCFELSYLNLILF